MVFYSPKLYFCADIIMILRLCPTVRLLTNDWNMNQRAISIKSKNIKNKHGNALIAALSVQSQSYVWWEPLAETPSNVLDAQGLPDHRTRSSNLPLTPFFLAPEVKWGTVWIVQHDMHSAAGAGAPASCKKSIVPTIMKINTWGTIAIICFWSHELNRQDNVQEAKHRDQMS